MAGRVPRVRQAEIYHRCEIKIALGDEFPKMGKTASPGRKNNHKCKVPRSAPSKQEVKAPNNLVWCEGPARDKSNNVIPNPNALCTSRFRRKEKKGQKECPRGAAATLPFPSFCTAIGKNSGRGPPNMHMSPKVCAINVPKREGSSQLRQVAPQLHKCRSPAQLRSRGSTKNLNKSQL